MSRQARAEWQDAEIRQLVFDASGALCIVLDRMAVFRRRDEQDDASGFERAEVHVCGVRGVRVGPLRDGSGANAGGGGPIFAEGDCVTDGAAITRDGLALDVVPCASKVEVRGIELRTRLLSIDIECDSLLVILPDAGNSLLPPPPRPPRVSTTQSETPTTPFDPTLPPFRLPAPLAGPSRAHLGAALPAVSPRLTTRELGEPAAPVPISPARDVFFSDEDD